MNLLAIDTCLGACSAAVLSEGQLVASRRELMQRGHAEVIAPMTRDVLAEARLELRSLDRIIVTTGPGTFTGVRIGLSLAQGLGRGLNIDIAGIDTLRATAAPVLGSIAVTVCHAAGASGFAYVQHFTAEGVGKDAITLVRPEEIQVPDGNIVIGSAAALVPSAVLRPELDLPHARHFAVLGLEMAAGPTPGPLYIREADAKPMPTDLASRAPTLAMATPGDAAQMAHLHGLSFYEPWSATDIRAMLDVPGTLGLLAVSGETTIGFLLARAIVGEAEILTLCVAPSARRHGTGRALLDALMIELRARQVEQLHLEVAADNSAALRLYEAAGFAHGGRRKSYYKRRAGACDALTLHMPVP